ncbi:MAG: response regulator [Desulfovibrionaceae bacterium]|nr:response regulator [Desulfovibrionaceae bacterium]
MGGRIWAESPARGGSLFRFLVPLKRAERAPGPGRAAPETSAAERPKKASGAKRILVVEDNPANIKVAQAHIKAMGHENAVATTGKQALSMLAAEPFDLVLMDIGLPEMDGFEAIEAIRAGNNVLDPRVPIIVLSAHALTSVKEKSLRAGADGFLTKPIDFESMSGLLQTHLDRGRPPEGRAPALLDREQARQRLGVDAEDFKDIFETSLAELTQGLSELNAALRTGDLAEAARLCHRLKGAAGNMGADACQGILSHLESAADRGDLEPVQRLHSELDREFARVLAQVRPGQA